MYTNSPVLIRVKPQERQRSNWLMAQEQRAIAWLCSRIPVSISSNALTGIGILGSVLVGLVLLLGKNQREWLWLGIVGLAVNWFGDSLDGRLAYYRKRPRKWYGFALDLMSDWISLSCVTLALAYYLPWPIVPQLLAAAYGARMLLALMHYKITQEYSIDSGKLGPTEARLVMATAFVAEFFVPSSLLWLSLLGLLMLSAVNAFELRQVLQLADARDRAERRASLAKSRS